MKTVTLTFHVKDIHFGDDGGEFFEQQLTNEAESIQENSECGLQLHEIEID